MAVLTAIELAELRRDMAKGQTEINYNKPIINSAIQAIEDWFENNKATGAQAIDTATSPYVFSSQQKKRLFAYWNRQKFRREDV
jgi:hypothetical protein